MSRAAKRLAFAYPGDLDTPTGGYGYARRIIAGLEALGWQVERVPLGAGFPHAGAKTRKTALSLLQAQPEDIPVVVDGLAFGALANEAETLAKTHLLVALVHHPLALETGIDATTQAALRASERRSLAAARAVIASSPATAAELVADYGVAEARIAVVVPGTDPAEGQPRPFRRDDTIRILSVGSLVPRKGHAMLIEALSELATLPWRLDVAGDDRLDPGHAATLRGLVTDLGLADRVTLHGALSADRLETLYSDADFFALATRYEGYGMAFAEATVRGLPIVATGAGAVSETIQPGTWLVFAADDRVGFREGLKRMITDDAFRQACAEKARASANNYPTWHESAQRFAQAIEALA